ncbi:hypothetical protein V8G54_036462 [Vigna mungo]|uniref:Uncharacterized protein n=1 Tax=Vigna mungo TaxID=3915 RepID=A0AAQ3RCS3_VIGMU
MEVLYMKLYDQYTEVKTKKLSDLEHPNEEQQLKFINCLSAAEEAIKHLKTEKEELLAQVNDLRVELASLKAAIDNQLADYQMLLRKESHKNETFSEEVEKLQLLCQEGAYQDLDNNKRIVAIRNHQVEGALPTELQEDRHTYIPLKVLQRRNQQPHGKEIPQLLIQWQEGGLEGATWEEKHYIRPQFPNFNLEDKVDVGEEGNVRPLQVYEEE